MSGHTYRWPPDVLDGVVEILGRHTNPNDAVAEISRWVGRPVNRKALDHALSRIGRGTTYSNLRGSALPTRDTIPQPATSPAPEAEVRWRQTTEPGGEEPTERPSGASVDGLDWDEDDAETVGRGAATLPAPSPSAPECPKPPPSQTAIDPDLAELIKLTKRGAMPLEELCDRLEVHPRRARELIDHARDQGYAVEIDGDHVGRRPKTESPLAEQIVRVASSGDPHKFAAVGDIHFGSKHCLKPQLRHFCDYAYAQGVRTFLQVGDMLDGVYRHSTWEQSHRGFAEQMQEAIDCLPRYPDATWRYVIGNHEQTMEDHSGIEAGLAMQQAFAAAGRSDVHYHGSRGAYLRLLAPGEKRGLLVELWHPRDKSSAYAKSYRLQKRVERYAPGAKADCLCAGHWHQSIYVPVRAVHALACGTFQGGQSSFGKSLGGAPDIGSWIVEYSLTEGGTVRTFKPEWVAYYEVEHVRDVNLG